MKALILLAFLPACAMFDAPASVCFIGNCADLVPIERDLKDPAFLKHVCAAGAVTPACWRAGVRST